MPARAKTEPDSQTVGKHRRVAHFRDARSSSGPALCDIARDVVRFRTDKVQSAQGSPNSRNETNRRAMSTRFPSHDGATGRGGRNTREPAHAEAESKRADARLSFYTRSVDQHAS